MIQILGIRTYFNRKKDKEDKKDEFFGKNWRAPTVLDLLANYETYLEKIPEVDRWNIYFTQFQAGSKRREFKEQWVIPFDIDDIDPLLIPENASDAAKLIAEMKGQKPPANPYLEVFSKTLGLNVSDIGAIFSGHGLHVIIQLKEPFTDISFFTKKRPFYKAICEKLNLALAQAKLPGHMDPGIFNQGVIGFRMPGTENRKPDKPLAIVKLLQRNLTPVDFDLVKLSGLPEVSDQEQLPKRIYSTPDTQAVLSGCDFLKHCKKNPNEVHDPEWYAMLSIVGRLEDGAKLSHQYSVGHKNYSEADTETKLNRALTNFGARTCESINKLPHWNKCKECPNFEKIKSPILIRGEEYIETQGTGFHKVTYDQNSNPKIGKPIYEDLRRFFDLTYKYKCLGATKTCYIWTGTYYQEYDLLESFAQNYFRPHALSHMTEEFKKLIWRTNIVTPKWFTSTTKRKINFKNGIYNLETGDLEPHSRDIGFRYVLPYDYDPEARAHQFEKFLSEITCGDKEIAQVLLEFAGYSFSGDRCWARKVLVMTGRGFNGKSTFMNVLRAAAGEDNFSDFEMADLRVETNCQVMDGKLFNLAEETPQKSWEETGYFKNLSTGGRMKCRQLYKKVYHVENKTKLMFACNDMPPTKDSSDAFYSRLLLVPFNAKFQKQNDDKHMLEKLLTELPGIFNLIVEGYDRLVKQQGFTDANAVEKAVEEFRLESDHAARWILENIKCNKLNGGLKFLWRREVYQAYRTSMINEGERPLNNIPFGRKLNQLIPDSKDRIIDKKEGGIHDRVILDAEYFSQEKF